jgi:hypothetical protein
MLPQLHRLLRRQPIGIHDDFISPVDAHALVDLFGAGREDEGVAAVLTEATPAGGAGGVGSEVLVKDLGGERIRQRQKQREGVYLLPEVESE